MSLSANDYRLADEHLAAIPTYGEGELGDVVLEDWCVNCGRTGIIPHPLWGEFWSVMTAKFGEAPVIDQQDREERDAWEKKWWGEHGYPDAYEAPRGLPPEEEPCEECGGHGRTLTRHGLVVLTFLRRWGFTQKEG